MSNQLHAFKALITYAVLVPMADGSSGVLDERHARRLADRCRSGKIRPRVPGKVDETHRARGGGQRRREALDVHAAAGVDIDEARAESCRGETVDRGDDAVGGNQYLVAGAQAKRVCGNRERHRAAGRERAMGDTRQTCDLLGERLRCRTWSDEPAQDLISNGLRAAGRHADRRS